LGGIGEEIKVGSAEEGREGGRVSAGILNGRLIVSRGHIISRRGYIISRRG
jgi:hypothetical protein